MIGTVDSAPPWRKEGHWLSYAFYGVSAFVLCSAGWALIVFAFMLAFLACASVIMEPPFNSLVARGLMLVAAPVVVLFVTGGLGTFGVKLASWANRRFRAASPALNYRGGRVYYFPKGYSATVRGPGDIAFRSGGIAILGTCRRGVPSITSVLIHMTAFAIAMGLFQAHFYVMGVIVFAGGVALQSLARAYAEKRAPISPPCLSSCLICREDIKRVYADGPLVTILFAAAPTPGLRAVQFIVAPEFRDGFFAQFARTFPGLLPKEYELAVDRATRERGAREVDGRTPAPLRG